jgi:prevent-host-death family protein
MITIGLRELRQQASELVRKAEAGETIIVTVSGREVAELNPVRRNRWRSGNDIAAIFSGPPDPDWVEDRDAIDGTLQDPFTR